MGLIVRKADLVDVVADALGGTKKQGAKAVDALLGCIQDTLSKGGKVQLSGFGTFEVRTRRQRKARNPRTHEEIMVPASKAPAFKAGQPLKKVVNS